MAIRAEGIEIFEQAVLRVRLDCFVASACRNDVRTPKSFVVPANQRVRLLPARWQAPGPIRRVACFKRRCWTTFAQRLTPVVMGPCVRRDDVADSIFKQQRPSLRGA